jgi:hypothetical protein
MLNSTLLVSAKSESVAEFYAMLTLTLAGNCEWSYTERRRAYSACTCVCTLLSLTLHAHNLQSLNPHGEIHTEFGSALTTPEP